MVINFEFLDSEPIENVITCMNFKIDRVIFLGYSEVIEERKSSTEKFLTKYCGVKQVRFLPLSHTDFNSVTKVMRSEIQREVSNGNNVFFDITGGESLILVAFGFLAAELDISMHMYDIPKNKLITIRKGATGMIFDNAPAAVVHLDTDRFIELHGGVINHRLHKDIKGNCGELLNHIDSLWRVVRKYDDVWNAFSSLCRTCFPPDGNLTAAASAREVSIELKSIKTHNRLISILKDLSAAGAIDSLDCSDGWYSFKYTNEAAKNCLWEGGSILELYVYSHYLEVSDYCKVGVHIDWDGVIHASPGKDVLNEVDVLALTGNIPTFVSCKSGKMGPEQTLHALYELQTVADKFGGKYARKVLISVRPPSSNIYLERAKELGIEVKVMSDVRR